MGAAFNRQQLKEQKEKFDAEREQVDSWWALPFEELSGTPMPKVNYPMYTGVFFAIADMLATETEMLEKHIKALDQELALIHQQIDRLQRY